MSYQEYAQLGKGTRRKDDGNGLPQRHESDVVDRPYHRAAASFSVPRPSPPHSSSSSTSSATLSPSNSASQKDAGSPTAERSGVGGVAGRPNRGSLSRFKELELGAGTEKKPNLVDVELPWRPSYLRRRVLAMFLSVFAALIIALEVLGDLSNRNAGVANGDTSRRTIYAWTYLPILALTVLAGMWTRVDYQAKAAAPWVRMSRGPAPAEKTLLLDYVDMWLPVSIVRAVLNRDVVVACTAMVSLHLGLIVVVSTALLTLSLVDVPNQNSKITLDTAFLNDPAGLTRADSYPFLAMVGLLQGNISYPDGVSSQYAYQQFSADVPFGTEIHATVDGFSASLDCEAAQLSLAGAQYYKTGIQLNTTVSIQGCSIDMPVFSQAFLSNSTILFLRLGHGACGGSTDPQDQRIVIVFGSETINSSSLAATMNSTNDGVSVNTTISQSTQLICKPTYAISQLDIKKDDLSVFDLDLSDTDTTTLSNVQPWDIAQAFFDSYRGPLVGNFSDTSPPFYQGGNLTVDPAMYLALSLRRATAGSPVSLSALFDRTTLQSVAGDYFQQYTALLALRSLMEDTSLSATGTIMLRGERLLVRSFAVQLMVTLLGVSVILTVVAMCFVPRKGFLPRDPNTIIDTAALIAHSRTLLQSLRGAGGGSEKFLRGRLSGNQYFIGVEAYEHGSSSDPGYFKIFGGASTAHVNAGYAEETGKYSYPINLHPLVRIASLLGVVAIIILLEVTLRASQNNNGLTDVMDDTYSHFLWTAMPALILSHFATYFASVDFTTRALAPYVALKDGSAFHHSVSLNYLDKTAPHAIYDSVRHRNFAVVAAGLTLLVSSLFVPLAAPIFSEVTIPATVTVRLLSQDFFSQNSSTPSSDICLSCRNGTIVSSLILNDNLSYPPFTYEDLLFPTMVLDTDQVPSAYPDDVTITASIPAVRPSMTCRIVPQSQVSPIFTPDSAEPPQTNTTEGNIIGVGFMDETGSMLAVYTKRPPQGAMAQVQVTDPNPFFGASLHKLLDLGNGTAVSHWVYIWGQIADADTNHTTLQTISAMSCNESAQQVTALATFHGTSLTILPSDPPVVDDSSAVPLSIGLNDNWDYSDLPSPSTPHLLDPFFATLVASRYAVPIDLLSDPTPSAVDRIAAAIVFQHAIIRTQILNLSRQPSTNLSTTPIPLSATGQAPLPPPSSPLTFNGTATSLTVTTTAHQPTLRHATTTLSPVLTATRRLSQSPPATRALQSLLLLTIILSLLTFFLSRKPPLHPRPNHPSSIASCAALLADGNTFGLLGRGAEWASVEQLRELFLDGLHVAMGFRMGWERPRRRNGRRGRDDGDDGNGGLEGEGGGRVLGVSAIRTGGWGGGEGVGLGLQARVGLGHRGRVGDWGWT
ncbi:hypothetical protein CONLIGDRAFT_612305 [Coniochaeta ligniaria NRRL 30616]|uniref:Uncharacterized protein n=1 Tax=Coniochaeta ligniaria NRRL 30616 TaxID=1408157 RepID=A0A1J7JFA9_9PEZI|nr:hypothetical protein CONLIGDRAFT_612305 [Coniochaeta ligniaria NRRL 30616]